MKLNVFIITVSLVLFSSCALHKGHLSFQTKSDEIIATPKIKKFINDHPNPSIVLKATRVENKSTQSDPNNYIYNAIEKELLLAGFDVKDRGLYNEVVEKSSEISYADLKKLTNTELLLELVNISTNIEYGTNKFYTKEGEEKISAKNFIQYGASIVFKLTIIETNQFAGSYTFNFTPCSDKTTGCECEIAYKNYSPVLVYPHLSQCKDPKNNSKGYEYVSKDVMEEFVRNGVKQMIQEMKN